jgi:hypothetical protein
VGAWRDSAGGLAMKQVLYGFITLTLLDGTHLHVEALRPNINIIHPEHGTQCARAHATAIVAGAKSYCVLESAEQIQKLVEDNQ